MHTPQSATLYVASALGVSEAGRHFYYGHLLPLIEGLGFGVLDPWRLTDAAKIAQVRTMEFGGARREAWRQLNWEIGEANRQAIERADGLLAVLDGPSVGGGIGAEIGFAYARGKRIVGYRGDFRRSGDNEGTIVGLQVEYFIRASGGTIVMALERLPEVLRATFPGTSSGA
jgi:nucleoside 2-deoxyribosyltransferase